MYAGHTPAASALTRFFLASFRFHAGLMAAGGRLTKPLELSAAQWQVLSTIARAERPETVANVGRLMGLTRQAVQRVANDMVSTGLLQCQPNPHHKRAPLFSMTAKGRALFDDVTARQVVWANALAKELEAIDIDRATELITQLSARFEAKVGEAQQADGS